MLKAQLLELLKPDEEFRLAVRGTDRVDEISNRMDKLESRIEEHSETIKELSKVIGGFVSKVEDLSRVVGELKVMTGSLGRRGEGFRKNCLQYIYKNLWEEGALNLGKLKSSLI